MNTLFWIGRILFSMMFIVSGLEHFRQLGSMSQYAASKGVPAPRFMVLLSGIAILAGGLSILFWTWVEVGAWLLIFFLLGAGLKMHDFWTVKDPMRKQAEMAQFMKNMTLAGAALMFYALYQRHELLG